MKTAIRVRRFGLCEGFVELYRLIPKPRDMGAYIAMFRKKWEQEGIVFAVGLTKGSVNLFSYRKNINFTGLVESIDSKRDTHRMKIIKRGDRYLLS